MPASCINPIFALFEGTTFHGFSSPADTDVPSLVASTDLKSHPKPADSSPTDTLLKALLAAFKDPACILDRYGHVRIASPQLENGQAQLPFSTHSPIQGQDYLDLWRQLDRPEGHEIPTLLQAVLNGHRPEASLLIPWSLDAHSRWLSWSVKSISSAPEPLFVVIHEDLTETVSTNRELERQRQIISDHTARQEELELILDSVHAQIWHVDRDGSVLRLNAAAKQASALHLDHTAPHSQPPSLLNVWHDPIAQEARNQTALHSGIPNLGQVERFHQLGRPRWASVDRIPIKIPSGETKALLIVIDDVTELKETEAQLRRDESFLTEMGRVAKVGGWEYDLRSGQLRWTQQVYEIHELDPSVGPSVPEAVEFYRHDARELIQSAVERAIATGLEYELELPLITAKHREVWVHTIGKTESENGRVVRLYGAIQEVTDRRKARERLRESEERFQLAASATNDGLWDWNPTKNTIWWSSGYFRILGYKPSEITASLARWAEVIHPEDRERVLANFDEGMKAENFFQDEYRMIRKDGKVLHVSDRALVVRASSGEPVRVVGGITDITQRRSAEEARASLERQLRQAQKMEAIGTLAGGIAHDFNNILGAILSSAELLLLDCPETHTNHATLQAIFNAGKRARDLIRQILTFSRQEEQKRTLLHLKPIVREAVNLLRATIPTTVEIHYNLGENLPCVIADPIQIHQVIMNLCTNAAHAMRNQPGRLEIHLTRALVEERVDLPHCTLQPGLYVQLTTRDNGHGMSPETTARVFEPFFTTKGPQEGTGLGLSVVLGIVKAYNGAITLQTAVGAGTTFNVLFPGVDDVAIDIPITPSDLSLGCGEHLLLVDDESVLLSVNTRILQRLGYRVTAFECPDQALRWVRDNPNDFELLMTDLTMPKMTGIQLSQAVVRQHPGLPVVLTSGLAGQISAEEALAAGVVEILAKPTTLETLGATLKRVIANSPRTKTLPARPL